LKARKPLSSNGAGERNSQAQNEVSGRPAAVMNRATAAKPAATGSGVSKRTRRIAKPGKAATPPEYWKTPGM
jgi:hypothetical protein